MDKYRVGPYWDKVRELEQERKQKEYERTIGLRALVTTCKQLNASVEITLEALKKNFLLDDESARKQIKLYW